MSEPNFLNLMRKILNEGDVQDNRTGIKTKALYGQTLQYNLQEGFPICTTRFISFRIVFEETMMFLRGITDTKVLEEKGINIWKGNTSREFLDKQDLKYLPEGHAGRNYAHQIRNFGGELEAEFYEPFRSNTYLTDEEAKCVDRKYDELAEDFVSSGGFDQLRYLVSELKTNSRRALITHWNPNDLEYTPLPPCHLLHMYHIDSQNRLHCSFVMRSSDFFLAQNMNVCSYALITHLLAKLLKCEVGTVTYFAHNCHIYENHEEACLKQLKNPILSSPKLIIKKDLKTLKDLLSLEYTDVELVDYEHGGKITAPMAV